MKHNFILKNNNNIKYLGKNQYRLLKEKIFKKLYYFYYNKKKKKFLLKNINNLKLNYLKKIYKYKKKNIFNFSFINKKLKLLLNINEINMLKLLILN
jgi:hypothetical protein